MKLFIKMTNEKGKIVSIGGDEYIDLDISVGNTLLESLTLRPIGDSRNGWGLYNSEDNPIAEVLDKKGTQHTQKKCVHDWDRYGKCTICGTWDTEGARL